MTWMLWGVVGLAFLLWCWCIGEIFFRRKLYENAKADWLNSIRFSQALPIDPQHLPAALVDRLHSTRPYQVLECMRAVGPVIGILLTILSFLLTETMETPDRLVVADADTENLRSISGLVLQHLWGVFVGAVIACVSQVLLSVVNVRFSEFAWRVVADSELLEDTRLGPLAELTGVTRRAARMISESLTALHEGVETNQQHFTHTMQGFREAILTGQNQHLAVLKQLSEATVATIDSGLREANQTTVRLQHACDGIASECAEVAQAVAAVATQVQSASPLLQALNTHAAELTVQARSLQEEASKLKPAAFEKAAAGISRVGSSIEQNNRETNELLLKKQAELGQSLESNVAAVMGRVEQAAAGVNDAGKSIERSNREAVESLNAGIRQAGNRIEQANQQANKRLLETQAELNKSLQSSVSTAMGSFERAATGVGEVGKNMERSSREAMKSLNAGIGQLESRIEQANRQTNQLLLEKQAELNKSLQSSVSTAMSSFKQAADGFGEAGKNMEQNNRDANERLCKSLEELNAWVNETISSAMDSLNAINSDAGKMMAELQQAHKHHGKNAEEQLARVRAAGDQLLSQCNEFARVFSNVDRSVAGAVQPVVQLAEQVGMLTASSNELITATQQFPERLERAVEEIEQLGRFLTFWRRRLESAPPATINGHPRNANGTFWRGFTDLEQSPMVRGWRWLRAKIQSRGSSSP